ncbi:MAG: DUF4982 domain-containing protein [Thermoguttaceae bacterium]|jgi:beta-galactosidase
MIFNKNYPSEQTLPAEHARRMILTCCLAGVLGLHASNVFAGERITLNFNPNWQFIKGDVPGATAQDPNQDNRKWTIVSTPHTYNDVDTFDDWAIPGHVGEQNQWSGRTWYRKIFEVPESYRGKKIYIEFEGVRQVAEVYLNGKLLGVSKTGFIPFGFDLTPQIQFGKQNVLAVMCDNRFMKDPVAEKGKPGTSQSLAQISAKVNEGIPEDVDQIAADQIPWNNPHWHPAHGGIYRNVYLHVVDPLHISLPLYSFLETAGPYIYCTDISEKSAMVNLEVPVQNQRSDGGEVELRAKVINHDGQPVLEIKKSMPIAAKSQVQFNISGVIDNPHLWEPDYPYLYRVVCSLIVNGETVDTCEIPLGIRTVRWDKDQGFFINGRHLKLHGWGQKPTDEWPGLGAAQPDWMHFYTLELMKKAGGNFVRWGHCAAGPSLIAAGDRLGIIADQPGLDGESDTRGAAWKLRSAGFRDAIIYYRNNPSILIWEGGNQKVTRDHAKELHGYVEKYDPHGGRVYAHRRADKTTAEFMDIGIGTEGGREIKELPVVEGEYDREESPRRVWDDFSPPNFGYPEAKGQTYQLNSEQYAANQVSEYVKKLGSANHSGGANWIFSDSTSGGRVAVEVARTSGEVDGVRLPKEAYYVCQAMFRSDPQVHIIGHWTYPEKTKKTVYVAGNGDEVELFVNGKSLGRGKVSNRYLFTFPDVAWEPGEIKAVSYVNGEPVAAETKHTIGSPVAIKLTPITGPGGLRADGSDIALIDVEAVDANGRRCPTFQKRVDFTVEGPAVWRGGYNSGKINSINNTYLDLECGINRVAVRSQLVPGTIAVTAMCEGLTTGSVSISSLPVKVVNGATADLPVMPAVILKNDRGGNYASAGAESSPASQMQTGKYVTSFSYSGPTAGVHVEADAQDGKKIYADGDLKYVNLPVELKGADYVQAVAADKLYSAVDLMEIAVKAGSVIWIVYDDRLPAPSWLSSQFKPADLSVSIDGRKMKAYNRRADREESVTLGSNAENAGVNGCNMYIVFVSPAPK